jgi:hypothetical protein
MYKYLIYKDELRKEHNNLMTHVNELFFASRHHSEIKIGFMNTN